MNKTGLLVLIGAFFAFGIPLFRLVTPGGQRDPDTLGEALLTGLSVAIGIAVVVPVRSRMRSGALRSGRDLRRDRGADERD